MASKVIREMFPALVDAAHTIGAVQTRNLGTLGGNLVTAVPSVDSGPTLVALDAQVTIAGPAGNRTMPLAQFFVGPRKTALKADELLVEIVIPKANLNKPAHFLKMGLRKGQALALVNAASSLWVEPKKNTCKDVRIALGAVAPTVIRATTAEKFLEGRAATPEKFRRSRPPRRRRRAADQRHARLGRISQGHRRRSRQAHARSRLRAKQDG